MCQGSWKLRQEGKDFTCGKSCTFPLRKIIETHPHVLGIHSVIAMESGRLDVDSVEANGIAKETTVIATNKTLTDVDSNRQDTTENSIMGKPNNENEIDDGVHEKMLKDENKVSPTKDATEVCY